MTILGTFIVIFHLIFNQNLNFNFHYLFLLYYLETFHIFLCLCCTNSSRLLDLFTMCEWNPCIMAVMSEWNPWKEMKMEAERGGDKIGGVCASLRISPNIRGLSYQSFSPSAFPSLYPCIYLIFAEIFVFARTLFSFTITLFCISHEYYASFLHLFY